MSRLRRIHPSIRLLLAAVLALCLGVRVLTPAGFMPSFATGSLAIVPCPAAEGAPPVQPMPAMHHMDGMAMPDMVAPAPAHDHGKDGFHHQSCPYASAASLAGLDLGGIAVALVVLIAVLPLLSPVLRVYRLRATRERPPAQGPPPPL